jgi:putative ABC transport system substrate-binding protein
MQGTVKLDATTSVADSLGVQMKPLPIRSPEDVEAVLAAALTWPAEGILVFTNGSPMVINLIPRLVEFQAQNRIPIVFDNTPDGQTRGGLMSYGLSNADNGRLGARLVDRILKGASPADLPVEQPTVYNFVVNQTVANALGITIPPEVGQEVTHWDT